MRSDISTSFQRARVSRALWLKIVPLSLFTPTSAWKAGFCKLVVWRMWLVVWLGGVGLGWVGLGWVGLGWVGLSCLVLSCLVLSCLALPCLALPCPALPCPALPCPALPCPALPCPALPCPALPCPALPCTERREPQHHKVAQLSHSKVRSWTLLPPSSSSVFFLFTLGRNAHGTQWSSSSQLSWRSGCFDPVLSRCGA